MVDRVDLLIAVIGIVVSILGSSTALWMALAKKADREDVSRLETKIDAVETRLETKIDGLETRLETRFTRLETRLDALILRFVPDHLPEAGT
jgi:sensor domain CHASE-containing protein